MGKKRFSPKQRATNQNIKNVDNDKPILYSLLQKQKVQYFGVAKRGRGAERLMEEKKEEGKNFDSFAVMPFDSIEKAEKREKQLIRKVRPPLNILGKKKPKS